MRRYFFFHFLLFCVLLLSGCASLSPRSINAVDTIGVEQTTGEQPPEGAQIVDFKAFNQKMESGYLCKPEGAGLFAGVIYNHGGTGGDQIGGDPESTCKALADAGYVGFSPLRRVGSVPQGLSEIQAGLEFIKALPYVNSNQIAMIGFSRGGALTYLLADDSSLDAIILMATAPVDEEKAQQSTITAPVLLLVAENDTPAPWNGGKDLHQGMQDLYNGLRSTGANVTLKVYPAYSEHGHFMFFEIGDYWKDVVDFLKQHIS